MAKALVLGASGGFGGQMARTLAGAGWEVARYQRGHNMAAAAQGCDLIVNGLNPPNYHAWDRLIPEITTNVLAASQASGARVLVPGNVYPYGRQPAPWGPDTPHVPCSRKGKIRAEMEARYRAAAEGGAPPVILLRAGDFMQAGVPAMMMHRVMLALVRKGRVQALGDPGAMHAWAWLPDMTRAAADLLALEGLPPYADIPFPGHAFTIDHLATVVARLTGRPMRVTRFPVWLFTVTSPVWELARELREMLYLNDHPHWLDPAPLRTLLPGFTATPLEEVVAQHLRAQGVALAA